MRPSTLLTAICLAGTVLSAPAGAQSPAVYDPTIGTLPQAQGWTAIDTDPSSTPGVAGGLLLQGPTTAAGTEYWESAAPTGTTWDFTRDTLTITARLNVIASSYYNSGGLRRTGYYFFAGDSQGRFVHLAIASDRVFLDRDSNAPSGGPAQALFDTTGFHDYRFVIGPTGAQAFIDGSLITSAALGATGATGSSGTVSFGDESILASSRTQLGRFQYTVTPEPSAVSALSLGTLAVAALRMRACRRRHNG